MDHRFRLDESGQTPEQGAVIQAARISSITLEMAAAAIHSGAYIFRDFTPRHLSSLVE
jgi:hypothetical protein